MGDRTALVLGGGGVTGIAWELGIALGLERHGIHLRKADRLVGTSAGSSVAAQLVGPLSLDELVARQRDGYVEEIPAATSRPTTWSIVRATMLSRDKVAALRRLGADALAADDAELAQRRHRVIARRVETDQWPDRDLLITAVDVLSGETRVFDRTSGVGLTEAVEASCAVPMTFPPVEVQGRRYMDGGMSSVTHVELAQGCQRVLVLAPITLGVKRQLARVGLATHSAVIGPDRLARTALGNNPLDPSARRASVEAGVEQASRIVDRVREVWTS